MSFWFDKIPDTYPNYNEVIEEAKNRSSNFDPKEGINFLLNLAGTLPHSPVKDEYTDYVYLEFAGSQLDNPVISPENKVDIFKALFEPTRDLGNAVADIGKWHSLDTENDQVTAHRMLKYASEIFEQVVDQLDEKTSPEIKYEIILEDYARVAGLQDSAGDEIGAKKTAIMVTPHLISLTKESDNSVDHYTLFSELTLMAMYIGELDSPEVAHILEVLPNEYADQVTHTLRDRETFSLIMSPSSDDYSGLLDTINNVTDLSFWHDMLNLVKSDEPKSLEKVNRLIDIIDSNFPKLFDESYEELLIMGPAEAVLYSISRDDLLVKYYTSVLNNTHDIHMLSRFAGECGYENDAARFSEMVKALKLSREQSAKLFEEYFIKVREKNKSS